MRINFHNSHTNQLAQYRTDPEKFVYTELVEKDGKIIEQKHTVGVKAGVSAFYFIGTLIHTK